MDKKGLTQFDFVTHTGKNHLIHRSDPSTTPALCNRQPPSGTSGGWVYRLPWYGDEENFCRNCVAKAKKEGRWFVPLTTGELDALAVRTVEIVRFPPSGKSYELILRPVMQRHVETGAPTRYRVGVYTTETIGAQRFLDEHDRSLNRLYFARRTGEEPISLVGVAIAPAELKPEHLDDRSAFIAYVESCGFTVAEE